MVNSVGSDVGSSLVGVSVGSDIGKRVSIIGAPVSEDGARVEEDGAHVEEKVGLWVAHTYKSLLGESVPTSVILSAIESSSILLSISAGVRFGL